MARQQSRDERDESEIFETIKATYAFAPEPEQRAMVRQLRDRLPTIAEDQRMSLIDSIEREIGVGLEWQDPEF